MFALLLLVLIVYFPNGLLTPFNNQLVLNVKTSDGIWNKIINGLLLISCFLM